MSFSTVLRSCCVFVTVLGGLAARADAAPVLVHAEPAAGQLVPAGNVALKLSFNSVIDPFRARLLLLGPSGVPQLLPASPTDDEQHGLATTVALAPGHYVLHWRMRGQAGDPAQGTLPFDVGAAPGTTALPASASSSPVAASVVKK
ncbi:copper resistance CopC family protein [Komagataeibacter medellinensis]|uniref:copper resistance CopC family protein n=1 Tax=Komagataeibacter medellinensis TaxID=1177712 RepID=UPI0006811B50|nr:copper resistance CopC family protein [Komagataeibacter medellinensis]